MFPFLWCIVTAFGALFPLDRRGQGQYTPFRFLPPLFSLGSQSVFSSSARACDFSFFPLPFCLLGLFNRIFCLWSFRRRFSILHRPQETRSLPSLSFFHPFSTPAGIVHFFPPNIRRGSVSVFFIFIHAPPPLSPTAIIAVAFFSPSPFNESFLLSSLSQSRGSPPRNDSILPWRRSSLRPRETPPPFLNVWKMSPPFFLKCVPSLYSGGRVPFLPGVRDAFYRLPASPRTGPMRSSPPPPPPCRGFFPTFHN